MCLVIDYDLVDSREFGKGWVDIEGFFRRNRMWELVLVDPDLDESAIVIAEVTGMDLEKSGGPCICSTARQLILCKCTCPPRWSGLNQVMNRATAEV